MSQPTQNERGLPTTKDEVGNTNVSDKAIDIKLVSRIDSSTTTFNDGIFIAIINNPSSSGFFGSKIKELIWNAKHIYRYISGTYSAEVKYNACKALLKLYQKLKALEAEAPRGQSGELLDDENSLLSDEIIKKTWDETNPKKVEDLIFFQEVPSFNEFIILYEYNEKSKKNSLPKIKKGIKVNYKSKSTYLPVEINFEADIQMLNNFYKQCNQIGILTSIENAVLALGKFKFAEYERALIELGYKWKCNESIKEKYIKIYCDVLSGLIKTSDNYKFNLLKHTIIDFKKFGSYLYNYTTDGVPNIVIESESWNSIIKSVEEDKDRHINLLSKLKLLYRKEYKKDAENLFELQFFNTDPNFDYKNFEARLIKIHDLFYKQDDISKFAFEYTKFQKYLESLSDVTKDINDAGVVKLFQFVRTFKLDIYDNLTFGVLKYELFYQIVGTICFYFRKTNYTCRRWTITETGYVLGLNLEDIYSFFETSFLQDTDLSNFPNSSCAGYLEIKYRFDAFILDSDRINNMSPDTANLEEYLQIEPSFSLSKDEEKYKVFVKASHAFLCLQVMAKKIGGKLCSVQHVEQILEECTSVSKDVIKARILRLNTGDFSFGRNVSLRIDQRQQIVIKESKEETVLNFSLIYIDKNNRNGYIEFDSFPGVYFELTEGAFAKIWDNAGFDVLKKKTTPIIKFYNDTIQLLGMVVSLGTASTAKEFLIDFIIDETIERAPISDKAKLAASVFGNLSSARALTIGASASLKVVGKILSGSPTLLAKISRIRYTPKFRKSPLPKAKVNPTPRSLRKQEAEIDKLLSQYSGDKKLDLLKREKYALLRESIAGNIKIKEAKSKLIGIENRVRERIGEIFAIGVVKSLKDGDLWEVVASIPTRGKGPQIFDFVFKDKKGNFLILEAKGGESTSLGTVNRYNYSINGEQTIKRGKIKQASGEWVFQRIMEIAKTDKELARNIFIACKEGKIEMIVTKIGNPKDYTTLIKDYFLKENYKSIAKFDIEKFLNG